MDIKDLNNTIRKLDLVAMEVDVLYVCVHTHMCTHTHVTLFHSTECTFFSSTYGAYAKFTYDHKASFNTFQRF